MNVFWIDGGYGASLLRRGIVTNVWWVHKLKPILGEWVWARLHSIHYALRFSGQPLVQPSMKCVWHSEASRYGESHWFGWSSRTLVVQGWKRLVRANWNEVHDPYTGSWADTIMLAVASVKLWVCAHGLRSLSDRLTDLYILNLPGTLSAKLGVFNLKSSLYSNRTSRTILHRVNALWKVAMLDAKARYSVIDGRNTNTWKLQSILDDVWLLEGGRPRMLDVYKGNRWNLAMLLTTVWQWGASWLSAIANSVQPLVSASHHDKPYVLRCCITGKTLTL